MTATEFIGAYEDIAKLKAAAMAAGCPEDGSFLDYVEASDHRTAKSFKSKFEAVAWVQKSILENKTAFGCGDVIEGKKIEPRERCRYCVCNGWQTISRTIVEDSGPLDEEVADSDCLMEAA